MDSRWRRASLRRRAAGVADVAAAAMTGTRVVRGMVSPGKARRGAVVASEVRAARAGSSYL